MMGDAIGKFAIFASGIAIGTAITMKYMQSKYERIISEDIDAIKELYSNKLKEALKKNTDEDDTETVSEPMEKPVDISESKEEKTDYSKVINDHGYTPKVKEYDDDDSPYDGPYVIAPEFFGEYEDYDTVELTLYADGFVTYSMSGDVIDDVDDVIGLENLDYMGVHDDNALHIRDEERKIDYEILQDLRNYRDLVRDGTEV